MGTVAFIESNATGHGINALNVAKKLGHTVLFCAEDPDFYRNANPLVDPFAPVDRLIVTDTYDAEALDAALAGIEIDAVIAFDDYHLPPASELAARRGLPHPDLAGIEHCRRKDKMRARLAEHGLTRPGFAVVGDLSEPTSPVGYPCVVKPVDDSGSVAVTVCTDDVRYRAAVAAVLRRRVNVRGYRLTPLCLVEEYINGTEYSAEVLWGDGLWHPLGITSKVICAPPHAAELGLAFPTRLDPELDAKIRCEVIRWLEVLGLGWGSAHVEFRVDGNAIIPVEVNPRLGGGRLPDLISIATGLDPLEYFIELSLGNDAPADLSVLTADRVAAIHFLTSDRAGILERIDGVGAAFSAPGVRDALATAALPKEIPAYQDNYGFLGHVIAEGPDVDQAMRLADQAAELITLQFRA